MTQLDYVLHGPMPTLGFDAKGQIVSCNRAWVYFTGLHEEHWLQLTWDAMQAADSLFVWSSMLQQSGYEGQRIYLHGKDGNALPCLINMFSHPDSEDVAFVAQAQGLASLVRQQDQDIYSAYEQGRRATEEDFAHRMGNTFSSFIQHTDTLSKQVKILRKLSDGLGQMSEKIKQGDDPKYLVKHQFVLNRASKILSEVADQGLVGPLKEMRNQLGQVQREVSHKPAFATTGQQQANQQFLLLPLLHDAIDAKVFKKVRLGIDCDADLEVRGVSRNLLIQVIKHLINNGLEAIQKQIDNNTADRQIGNIKIVVRLESLDQIDWLHLTVEDDGCGIADDEENLILSAGYTTKAGHAGNGLHWVANYLQSLGGSIHIGQSQEEMSTRVAVTLPMDAG